MKKNLDSEKKELKKGFYMFMKMNKIVYFTGEFDASNGDPIIKIEANATANKFLPPCFIKELYRIEEKDVEEIINDLRKRANWLEKGLKD
jgi:uncharacterized alpha/beta hydrolase family protein